MALGPNFGNVVGGESSGKGGGGTTSYFPARVKEVVTNDSTDPKSLFVQNGGWASLGFISFHPLFGPVDGNDKGNLIAKPLFGNFTQIPLVNEIVLILQAPNILNDDPQSQQFYYLTTVNIWNSSHHNGFPDLQNLSANTKQTMLTDYSKVRAGVKINPSNEIKQLNLGTKFIEDPSKARNLIPQQGDMIVSGRFGNSIRFSHTAKTDKSSKALNTWSVSGSNTDPITIIRNGQREIDAKLPKWLPTTEDINLDDSSIWLTSGQEIKIDFASKNLRSYKMATSTPAADVVNVPNIVIQPQTVDAKNADKELLDEAQNKQKATTQAASDVAAKNNTATTTGTAVLVGSSGTSGTQQVTPQRYVYDIQQVGPSKFIVVYENVVTPPLTISVKKSIYTGPGVNLSTPNAELIKKAKSELFFKLGPEINGMQPVNTGTATATNQAVSEAKGSSGTAGNAPVETPAASGSKDNPLTTKQLEDVGMPGEEVNSVVYQTDYAETETVTDVAVTAAQAKEIEKQTQGTSYFNNNNVTITFQGGSNIVSPGNALEMALALNPANKSLPIINSSLPYFNKRGTAHQDIIKVCPGSISDPFCAGGISYCFKKAQAANTGAKGTAWGVTWSSQGIYEQKQSQFIQLAYPTDITPSGLTAAGSLKLAILGGWGGACFAWGQGAGGQGHIGMLVKISGDTIYTIEFNTSIGKGGSQSNGGGLFLRKRKIQLMAVGGRKLASTKGLVDVDGKKYFNYFGFVNTSNLIGGSWAAQGLARDITLPSVKGVDLNDLKIYG